MKKAIALSVTLTILFATLTGCWGTSASSIGLIPDNINVPEIVLDVMHQKTAGFPV